MCLSIPAEVIEIRENEQAVVSSFGNKTEVNVGLLAEVETGDFVLIHAGFAIEKIDEEQAWESIKIWEEITSKQWQDQTPGKGV